MLAARRAPVAKNSVKLVRTDERANIKCTHCSKQRYLEPECYTKYPKKKVVFEKMLADKKALKKQQVLLNAAPTAYVAIATPLPLLPSVPYEFGNRQLRTFIATTILLSLLYNFGDTVYTNIANVDYA